ncbi:hypothetical protein BC332_11164 [Capsicum chinense]|nr:hypothetical protein BC332_11164 [Capsicum chinense]
MNRERFSVIELRDKKTNENLWKCQGKLQKDPKNMLVIAEESKLAQQYAELKQASEKFLQQKSKIQWLREGDSSTRFYHNYLKVERNNNRIFSVIDKDGNEKISIDGIAQVFTDFYNELLGAKIASRTHVNSTVIRQGSLVSENQRAMLQ